MNGLLVTGPDPPNWKPCGLFVCGGSGTGLVFENNELESPIVDRLSPPATRKLSGVRVEIAGR